MALGHYRSPKCRTLAQSNGTLQDTPLKLMNTTSRNTSRDRSQIRLLDRPAGSAGALVILPAGQAYNLGKDDDQSILVPDELTQAAIVALLGGGLCTCGKSDGTVACPCAPLEQHLTHTRQWIARHDGHCFDDPGYFSPEAPHEPSNHHVDGTCPECTANYHEQVPEGILPGQQFWVNCPACTACITIQYPSGKAEIQTP